MILRSLVVALIVAAYGSLVRADSPPPKCSASTNNPSTHSIQHSNQYDKATSGPTNVYQRFCTVCEDVIGGAVTITQSPWTAWCTNGCGWSTYGDLSAIAQWVVTVTNFAEGGVSTVNTEYYGPEELVHKYGSERPGTNCLSVLFTNVYDHGTACPLHGPYPVFDARAGCFVNLSAAPWEERTFGIRFEGEAAVEILSCVRETEESNESTKEISAGGIFRVSIDGVLPSAFTNVEWSVESTNKQMRIECMATNGLQAIFKVAKTSGHGEAHVWARLPVECADACRSSDAPCGACERKVTIKVGCACNACEEGAGQCSRTAGTSTAKRGGREVRITLNMGSLRGEQVGFLNLTLAAPSAGMASRERLDAVIDFRLGCAVQRDAGGRLQGVSGPQVLAAFEDVESNGQTGFRASFRDPATPDGVPYLKWEVQQIASNQVMVTKYEDNIRKTLTLYSHDATSGLWDMSQTDGAGQPLRQFQYGLQNLALGLSVEIQTAMDPQAGVAVITRRSIQTALAASS